MYIKHLIREKMEIQRRETCSTLNILLGYVENLNRRAEQTF